MSQPKPAITPALKQAVEVYLLATTSRQVIEPVVVGYQTEILARHQWPYAKGVLRPTDPRFGLPVLDPQETYLLTPEDFEIYLAEVVAQDKAHGFYAPPGYCPLGVAENAERNAARLVLDAAQYYTHISPDEALNDLDVYKELLKITVDFVVAETDINTADLLKPVTA